MLLSEADLPPTFTEYLAAKGLYDVENLTQSQFSTNYTAWLTLVFNTDAVQSWLATKGYSYPDGQFTVSLNQNSGSLLPTISYKSSGVTITIDQATLDALFSNKEAIDVSTGKVLQGRWYADLNNAPVVKTIADRSIDEDHPVSFTIPAGTFTDVDSASLTYTATLVDNGPLPSWLTFNSASQTFSGTPPQNYNGELNLTVTVSDGLLSASSSFKLTINPVNDDPTGSATAILADGEEDVAYTVSAVDLLKGFSDVDIATNGDILSISGLTADHGTVTDNGDGTFTITPANNFNGTIHLSYSVVDKAGASVAATQTYTMIPVNDQPVATGGDTSGDEDAEEITGTVGGTDVDGDALTYNLVAPVEGLTLNSDGSYSYVPAANFYGDVIFQYVANDGTVDSDPVTVTITVNPVNDQPVTSPVTLTSIEEDSGARVITQAELLANASDPEHDSLTATNLAISSGSGTLVDNNDGTWTYTPASNDDTTVSFSYTVTDGHDTVAGSASLDITPVDDVRVEDTSHDYDDKDIFGNTHTVRTRGSSDNDTLAGDEGTENDSINGLNGADTIYGRAGNDTLKGNAQNDTIYGGSGNDTIEGSGGADHIWGGSGGDTFQFGAGDGGDTIHDFGNGADVINLSALIPESLTFGGNGSIAAYTVVWQESNGNTIVSADTNGTGGADFSITLIGTGLKLTSSDFML
jgi:large repetitive protein